LATLAFALFAAALHAEPAAPAWMVQGGVGRSVTDVNVYRAAIRRYYGARWCNSDAGHVTGFWEGSMSLWAADRTILAAALSPVFVYEFTPERWDVMPYIALGIGVSRISGTRIMGRDLSSHFQFEDRVGFGLRFGPTMGNNLALRYMHYSNGGLAQPNHGIDIVMLSIGSSFGR